MFILHGLMGYNCWAASWLLHSRGSSKHWPEMPSSWPEASLGTAPWNLPPSSTVWTRQRFRSTFPLEQSGAGSSTHLEEWRPPSWKFQPCLRRRVFSRHRSDCDHLPLESLLSGVFRNHRNRLHWQGRPEGGWPEFLCKCCVFRPRTKDSWPRGRGRCTLVALWRLVGPKEKYTFLTNGYFCAK